MFVLYGNEPEYSETEMTIRGEGGEGDDSSEDEEDGENLNSSRLKN